MAMKDWEKIWDEEKGNYIRWVHKEKDLAVGIEKNKTYVIEKGNLKVKEFKTKSQAIAYAKRYMRTH